MSEQIAVRLSPELVTSLDELVTTGRFTTRAEAVRSAIESLVDQERRCRVGAEIAEGYRRIPQSDEDLAAAAAAATRSIHDEPWD
jgi:Arc/MetJ-type ribon-helix-helix transcriptional regulator